MSSGGSRPSSRDEVNVKVLLRCRPPSAEEISSRVPQVVECNDAQKQVTVTQNGVGKNINKVYHFDKVFGPTATQADVFEGAVVPIIEEVLEGFNCTIFAYGQTGTGKTYTMEGGPYMAVDGKVIAETAGVIPRAIERIFEFLEKSGADSSVKVSFMELYNEELTDLLDVNEAKSQKLRIMDSENRMVVQNLDEQVVQSAEEIFKILERGSAKRKTAETLLNVRSSRSHSVFSITIHIREISNTGEDVIKTGKLNLVDLAGSENISRSGAKDGRAREAASINQSLLTLGRVINALVEHSVHVPYRDSKLTRLLRDSLGGKTNTCIIATIAPTLLCGEETFSTLEYAHRAKNIRNRPVVNQKVSKVTMIRELNAEVKKLTEELTAQRRRDGVFMDVDQYETWQKDRVIVNEKMKSLTDEADERKKEVDGLRQKIAEREAQLSAQEDKLALQCFISAAHKRSEDALASHSTLLTSEVGRLAQHMEVASQIIARASHREVVNQKVVKSLASGLHERIQGLRNCAMEFTGTASKNLDTLCAGLKDFEARRQGKVGEMLDRGMRSQGLADGIVKVYDNGLEDVQMLYRNFESHIGESASRCLEAAKEEADKARRRVTTLETSLADTVTSLESNLRGITEAHKSASDAVRQSNMKVKQQLCGVKRSALEIETFNEASTKQHMADLKDLKGNLQQQQDELLNKLLGAVKQSMSAQMDQAVLCMSNLVASNERYAGMMVGVNEGLNKAYEELRSQEKAIASSATALCDDMSGCDDVLQAAKSINDRIKECQVGPDNLLFLVQSHCGHADAQVSKARDESVRIVKKARIEGEGKQKLLFDVNELAMNGMRQAAQEDVAFCRKMSEIAVGISETQQNVQAACAQTNSNVESQLESALGSFMWDDGSIACPDVNLNDLPGAAIIEKFRAPPVEYLVDKFEQGKREGLKLGRHLSASEVLQPRSIQNVVEPGSEPNDMERRRSSDPQSNGSVPNGVTLERGSRMNSRIPKLEQNRLGGSRSGGVVGNDQNGKRCRTFTDG